MPEGRGVYAICIMFGTFVSVITYLGNEYGIRFLLVNGLINLHEAFIYLLFTSLVALIIAGLLIIFISELDVHVLNSVNQTKLFLSAMLFCTQVIFVQTNVFMTITKRFSSAAKVAVLCELLKVLFSCISLYYFSTVEVVLLSCMFGNLIVIAWLVKKYELSPKSMENFSISNIKYIYTYGVKSFLFTFSNFATSHCGTFIVGTYMTSDKVGIYSLAYALVSKAQVIPDAINRYLVPKIVEEKVSSSKLKKVSFTILGLLIFCLISNLFVMFYAEKIILVFFGDDYLDSAILIKILFVGFSFKIISKPIEAYFSEVVGLPLRVSFVNILCLLIMILLMNTTIKDYGLTGVTFASVVSLFVGFIIFIVMHKNEFRKL